MNLTEFLNIVQISAGKSFSLPLLKEFLTIPNKPSLSNIFDLYNQDDNLASSIDSKKYAIVMEKILKDHESYGGNLESITNYIRKKPDKMTISTFDIRNLKIPTERMHKFTINVSGTLLYDVVEKIYDLSKEMNYELDMEIPSAKDQKLGFTDTIAIYSSNNNLLNTLDFIQNVKKFSNSFGNESKYCAEVVDGIAYDSFNTEHNKWNRELIGESAIEAIDNMIVNYIANHFELFGEANSKNYQQNRVEIIRTMMSQSKDVYASFDSYLRDSLVSRNIDPENIYLSENVREKYLGPRITISEAKIDNEELPKIEEDTYSFSESDLGDENIGKVSSDEIIGDRIKESPSDPAEPTTSDGNIAEDIKTGEEKVDGESIQELVYKPKQEETPDGPKYLTPKPSGSLKPLDDLKKTDLFDSSEIDKASSQEESPKEIFNGDEGASSENEIIKANGNDFDQEKTSALNKPFDENSSREEDEILGIEGTIENKDLIPIADPENVEPTIGDFFGAEFLKNLTTTSNDLSGYKANTVLEEFQKQRATEIAIMEEQAEKEKERSKVIKGKDDIPSTGSQERIEHERHLEELLKKANDKPEDQSIIEKRIHTPSTYKENDKGPNERSLDNMLLDLDKIKLTSDLDEKSRLIELENGVLGQRPEQVKDVPDETSEDKEVASKTDSPTAKSDSYENYLDQVLKEAKNPTNGQTFDGFSEGMHIIGNPASEALKPSEVFDASYAEADSRSETEKAFDARLEALNKQLEIRQGKTNSDFTSTADAEKYLSQLLNDVLDETDNTDLKSVDSYQTHEASQKEKGATEEKIDEMVRDRHSELPAVVKEDMSVEKSSIHKKNDEEEHLQGLLDAVLNENDTKTGNEGHEFIGFDNEDINVGNTFDMVHSAQALADAESKKVVESMSEGDLYLEGLLNGIYPPEQESESTEEKKDSDASRLGETSRGISAEKARLNAVYEDAFTPKPPLIEKKTDEEKKDSDASRLGETSRGISAEKARLIAVEEDAFTPKPPLIEKKTDAPKKYAVPKEVRQGEQHLDEVYKEATSEKKDEFTGFAKEMQGVTTQSDLVVGKQSLVSVSFQDQISKEIKTPYEEQRLEALLGNQTAKKASSKNLLSGIKEEIKSGAEYLESLVDEKLKDDSVLSEAFNGFDDEMLKDKESEVASSTQEVFGNPIKDKGVLIVPYEDQLQDYNRHLQEMSDLVDVKEKQLIASKELAKQEGDGVQETPGDDFKGFESISLDDYSEEQSISSAFANIEYTPLSSAEMEETSEVHHQI